MPVLGRRALTSTAQLLGILGGEAGKLLLYKHVGVRPEGIPGSVVSYLECLEGAPDDDLLALVGEMVREPDALRCHASPKYLFDARWRDFERWLLHDGWMIENGQLVRVAPAAEEATGVRDALLEKLAMNAIDADGGIRRAIERSAAAFVSEPPDLNASITHARIAMETTARRAAAARANGGGAPYSVDSWGKALEYLRNAGVLEPDEEQMLARMYAFISDGAHVPVGITREEWARLARTFALGGCYFVLRKHGAS